MGSTTARNIHNSEKQVSRNGTIAANKPYSLPTTAISTSAKQTKDNLYLTSKSIEVGLDHIHLLRVRRNSFFGVDAILFARWADVTLLRRKDSLVDHRTERGRDIFGNYIVG